MNAKTATSGRLVLRRRKRRNKEGYFVVEVPIYISTKEAIAMAKKAGISVSLPTIISWCKKFELGHQLGGHGGVWAIERNRFENFLQGTSGEDYGAN